MEELHALDEDNEVKSILIESEQKLNFKHALFTASRCAWGFSGAMLILVFLKENLFLENQMFPYAAKISFLIAFIAALMFDSCFLSLIKEKSE